MNNSEFFILIIIVGIGTYLTRLIFLISDFEILKNKIVKAGLNSVPITMLVALVIPYTFFVNGVLIFHRPEVYALLLTIPIVYKIKKAGLSIIIAFTLYFLIDLILFQ